MARNIKSKTGKKHAGTQTQEIDTALEIARLEEQVKLLKIENDVLRKYTVEKPDVTREDVYRRSPRIARISPNNDSIVEPARARSIRAPSLPKSVTKTLFKGCSCKGNCSSKICGCMKKENKCGESCKCNNVNCQNQEQSSTDTNKENVDNVNTDISHVDLQKEKRVANKHLQNVNVNRGLFSPDVAGPEIALDVEEFRTGSLHFGSSKTLTFDSDEENKIEDEKVKRKPKKGKGNEKEVQTARSRGQKTTLEVPNSKPVKKHRSTSNEEKRPKNDLQVEKHGLRRCLSSEMETQTDEDVEEASHGKKPNNYLKDIMQGMVSLRRGRPKAAERDAVESTATESTVTEVIEKNAQKRAEHSKKKRNAKLNKKSSADSKSDSSPNENETNTLQNASNKTHESLEQFHDETSHEESGKDNDSEADFNPMKPTRQLPRTPTHGSTETSTCNISDILLPLPISEVKQEEEEQPLPADFHQAEVDWAEYQAQLVACGKCNRKFYPSRIKKHQACCKKV